MVRQADREHGAGTSEEKGPSLLSKVPVCPVSDFALPLRASMV